MRLSALIVFLLIPQCTQAAVSISEVAWMGGIESANHEWIELHNDGPTIDVSGWTINDGMNLNIDLVGLIPASSFVVLERTSDESAQGDAFLIYTGALINSGATLQLLRSDGSVVDQLYGGESWQNIGGDNTTKETAQYTDKGWVTAVATPGEGAASSVETEEVVEEEKTVVKKTSSSGESLLLVEPDVTLKLDMSAPDLVYVNQPVLFNVEASKIGKNLINSLQFKWNYGDGMSSEGQEAKHVFKYPGTYVVTVYGGFKRQEAVTRQEITVLPVRLSLNKLDNGDIQINNDSPYELNISNYRLRSDTVFVFPEYSILLANQAITIPKKRVGSTKDRLVVLYDTAGEILSSLNLSNNNLREFAESIVPEPRLLGAAISKSIPPLKEKIDSYVPTKDSVVEKETLNPNQNTNLNSTVNNDGQSSRSRWTYFALVGLMMLGVAAIYITPKRNDIA